MTLAPQTIIVALGAIFLSGCITSPVAHVERNSSLIGTAPDSPIRIGETTRDDIFARFGQPSYSTEHFLACGYLFAPKIGERTGLLHGPCVFYFGTTDVNEMDDVWLEFDSHGVLKRCEKHLIDRCWGDEEKAWRQFARSVADTIRSE